MERKEREKEYCGGEQRKKGRTGIYDEGGKENEGRKEKLRRKI